MLTKIEGLILSKIPYDDRHVIANVLLRNGHRVSVVFFGGRGGGKKQKSSIIEVGFMLSIELQVTKSHVEVYHAKEWNLIWHHDLIRTNHQAFYLTCFFLELVNKIATQENLHDFNEDYRESVGLFITLSNALVYLENSLKNNSFYLHAHVVVFLSKLLLHLGVFPEREACCFCAHPLIEFNDMYLLPDAGGFACPPCLNQRKSYGVQSGRELWEVIGHITHKKYSELDGLKIEFKSLPKMLFNYFCFQFHLDEKDFKTQSMVF